MPFLFLGIIILGVGIYFTYYSKKNNDRDGMVGSSSLITAGILIIILFGLYQIASLIEK